MELRWLTDDEILDQVNPICKSRGWTELNVNDIQPTCRVLGGFEGERLVGWLALQLFPLIGPAFVEPEFQGRDLARKLSDEMHEFMVLAGARGAITICESPVVERLVQRHGMTRVQDPVYFWGGV